MVNAEMSLCGWVHLVVYVLMRMADLSLPPFPLLPLQGGDCAFHSLLRVSGVWNEPGLIVWRESRLCRASAYFRVPGVFLANAKMRSAGVGWEIQPRCEKGQTKAEQLLGVNKESSLCVSL